ncbi:MAG: tetratricopeptide repeat protein, partial [Elainellaceae cyanobacterium]
MLKVLAKLWKWVKGLFTQPEQNTPETSAERPALSDVEYENCFMQLLEAVEQGLSRGGLRGWLIARRVSADELADWLGRQRERWMAQPEQHGELAQRLERLGRVASGELGAVAAATGAALLARRQLAAGDSGQTEDREMSSLKRSPESRSSTVGEGGETNDVDSRIAEVAQQYQSGNPSEALELSKQITEDYPSEFRGWYISGLLLSDLGRKEDAIARYEEAIKHKPNLHEAWFNRGTALSDLGRNEDAIASYEQAIKHKP